MRRFAGWALVVAAAAGANAATAPISLAAEDLRIAWDPPDRAGRLSRAIDQIRSGLSAGPAARITAIALADELAELQQLGPLRDAVIALAGAFPSGWLRDVAGELALRAGDYAEAMRSMGESHVATRAQTARRATAAMAVGEPALALAILASDGVVDLFPEAGSGGTLQDDLRLLRFGALVDRAATRRAAFDAWRRGVRSGASGIAADALMLRTVAGEGMAGAADEVAIRRIEDLALSAGRRSASHAARALWARYRPDADVVRATACGVLLPHETFQRVDCQILAMRNLWGHGDYSAALAWARALRSEPATVEHPVLRDAYATTAAPIFEATGNVAAAEQLLRHALEGRASFAGRASLSLQLVGLLRRGGRLAEARAVLSRVQASALARDGGWLALETAMLASVDDAGSEVGELLERAVALRDDGRGVSSAHAAASPALQWALRGFEAHERGDLGMATAALERATGLAFEQIRGMRDHGTRLSLRSAWQPVLDQWATTLLAQQRPADALDVVEMARSGDVPGGTDATARHVVEHLDRTTAILVIADIGSTTWAWLGTSTGWDARPLAMRRDHIGALGEVLLQSAIGGASEAWRLAAGSLGDILVRPMVEAEWLRSVDNLLVVGGGALDGIPIDSLPWPDGGDDAVMDHLSVSRAQSLAWLDRLWHQSPRAGGSLTIAPYVARTTDREIRSVRGTAPGRVLRGELATELAVRHHIGAARLVHFAGHAVPVARDWGVGGLQLRPGRSLDGWLTYDEIERLPLAGSHVVLLGCETAASRQSEPSRSEAGSSLAEAFAAAGARSVVSYLWPIRDSEAAEFAAIYYGVGGPRIGLKALSHTKRELRRRHPLEPRRWAGAVWNGLPDPVGD